MTNLRLPSPAMVVALGALVMATGGTAFAMFNIPNNSITSGMIKNGDISYKDLGKNSVDTSELLKGAVNSSILSNFAVTAPKLQFDSITSAKIKDDAITSSDIADDAVGPAQIEDVDITSDGLNPGWSAQFSGTEPGYTVDAEGVVHLAGVVAPTDVHATSAALNLPPEASPPYDIELPVVGACGGVPTVVPAYIQRDDGTAAAGGIFFSPPVSGFSYYHLHGLSFVP